MSEILVSAFSPLKENNSINLVVKQDEKRIERMQILMEYLLERAISFGEFFISKNNKACILLKFPHKEKVTLKTIRKKNTLDRCLWELKKNAKETELLLF